MKHDDDGGGCMVELCMLSAYFLALAIGWILRATGILLLLGPVVIIQLTWLYVRGGRCSAAPGLDTKSPTGDHGQLGFFCIEALKPRHTSPLHKRA